MKTSEYNIAIIGGGILGASTGRELTQRFGASLIVLEAESDLAMHQTGHNSGVIHSGLYYKPGSLKAKNCVEGREAMYRFCDRYGIAHERCGKVVVATTKEELPRLDRLLERGQANGLKGIRRLSAEELKEHEPHVNGIAGLHVPETGIVDYKQVTQTFAQLAQEAGATIETSAKVKGCHRSGSKFILKTTSGDVSCHHLINCAGLQSDRVARMCGVNPGLQIIPFRGEYYELIPERCQLVRNLIYPVPDPRFPFLGVHFTRMVQGGVEAGPNAVLALRREGYRRLSFSLKDVLQLLTFRGFWRMAFKYGRTGMSELYRSFSKRAFLRSLQQLIPELTLRDIKPGGAGVRAQAVDRQGKLIDDFHIVEAEGMVHVLNAPSPAATASISIGRTIAELSAKRFGLKEKRAQTA